jgi:gliding motility-associated lipoprotein GldH
MRSNNCPLLSCLFALTVALAIAGCNRKTIYHHYEHTPVAGWEKSDTLTFTVKAKERAVVQRDVELRISGEYPFQRLNLVIEQTTYPAGISRRDTLNCDLIDPQGNIQGQGLSLYQYRFHMTDISLNEGDSLCINIRHNMKRELLSGVTDVGLRLRTY